MIAPAPVLEMAGVGRRFDSPGGHVDVLREVTIRIRAGEFVTVTGPSGSGKTTLLHLAGLLDRPSAGTIRFLGEDLGEADPDRLAGLRKRHVGTIYQQFHLLPHRSALDNVVFRFRYLDVAVCEARAQAREALERLGLGGQADRPARVLSGGEMQRVAIARAIVVPPALLLADEPTGNLDAESAERVMDCFTGLHGAGHTVLLATHNEALAARGTRRLACADGRVSERA